MERENQWRFKREEPKGSTALSTLMRKHNPATHKAWTEEALSERSGVSVATIKRLKSGKNGRRVSLETLLETLGVPKSGYEGFIEYTGPARPEPEPVAVPIHSADSTLPPPAAKPMLPPTPPEMFGRDVLVARVVGLLTVEALPTVLLHGWPGIGKTALSQKVLWDAAMVAHFGDRRYWVQGDRANDASMLLTEIALAMGLAASSKEAEVLATLREQGRCVLAIDNLETPLQRDKANCIALLRLLGADAGVALLASFRGEAGDAGSFWQHRIPVEELDEADAMALFAHIADVPAWASNARVRQTVKEVDRVPIAVILLANRARGMSLDRFRQEWEDARTRLLSPEENTSRDDNWSICLRFSLESPRLSACTAAPRLARMMGQLPDGIAAADAEALLPDEGNSAAHALQSVGLITYLRDTDRYRMLHPIREYLRDHFPPEAHSGDWNLIESLYLNSIHHSGIKSGFEISNKVRSSLLSEVNNIAAMLIHAFDSSAPARAFSATWEYGRLLYSSGQGSTEPLLRGATYMNIKSFRVAAADCLFTLGNIRQLKWQFKQAEIHYRLAIDAYKKAKVTRGLAYCIHSLGDICWRTSDMRQAKKYFLSALLIHQKIDNKEGMINCFIGIGNIYLRWSRLNDARMFYRAALTIIEQNKSKYSQATCIERLGDIRLRQSKINAAEQRYMKASSLYEYVGYSNGIASCEHQLGMVNVIQDKHDKAYQHYARALYIYEETGDKLGQVNCLKGIGEIHTRRSEHDQASVRISDAMILYKSIGEKIGIANCIQCMGDVYFDRRELDQAEEEYNEALSIYKYVGDKLSQAQCLHRIGDIYRIKSQLSNAETVYKHALSLYEEAETMDAQQDIHMSLGRIALRQQNITEAQRQFEEALHIGEVVQNWSSVADTWYFLSFVPDTLEVREERRQKANAIWRRFLTEEQIAAKWAS